MAVIGAGWAGCAAAVRLSQLGHRINLIESANQLGGRARSIDLHDMQIDNGQHIMLGAYSACLSLMKELKLDLGKSMLRLPLQMVYPKQTGMRFIAPRLPAPLHLLAALWNAEGLSGEDKLSLARFSTSARWMDWKLNHDCSVSELLAIHEQTQNLCTLLWNPLCLAALNTPPERASAQIFLNVLRDSLGAKRAASDMLIPKVDLSNLIPNAAARHIETHGGKVTTGVTVRAISPGNSMRWTLPDLNRKIGEVLEFDELIIATNFHQSRRLLAGVQSQQIKTDYDRTVDTSLRFESITTCYLQYAPTFRLNRAFFALIDRPDIGHWGQFVFDRSYLQVAQAGLIAVVISASDSAQSLTQSELSHAIAAQLASEFNNVELLEFQWSKVIHEKRATFSCLPNLQRPSNQTSIPGIYIAGDYTTGDYPATLEAAVRSGKKAADLIRQSLLNSDTAC
ncbi:hydroxysqualene dehydroxylase HpnE [Undibacterium sp. FT137W]|uniref:Hydroxysqualene dehydroxylase HpnE n=1 Tax=Undibacterium fentianense TaxID=2828728 RepID=A0A941E395_9BURK|nr:hydroxysqualene dehydroxylase HpnE [Undibacterium fentianense]